jgi:hypothetical protein
MNVFRFMSLRGSKDAPGPVPQKRTPGRGIIKARGESSGKEEPP